MGVLTSPCLTTVALMMGLLFSAISSATACSCPQRSNHDRFCGADFGSGSPPTSLNSCSWISEWSEMMKKEKKGVRGRYQCGLQK
ncbi:hypothetical protein ScPMuIL_008981 [Solemya velum]